MIGYVLRGSSSRRPALLPAVLILLALLASACGGGGGNGQPQQQFPDAVEELADSDLGTAGVPGTAELASLSTRGASLAGDYNQDGSVDSLDYIAVNNLSPVDGKLVTDVPEGEQFRRIIAWAIWEIPAAQGDHLVSLASDLSFSPAGTRSFFALANASSGFWELGGRAANGIGPETLHYEIDGTDVDGFSQAFDFGFTNGRDYIWPNGSAYLLVAIGHPGNAGYNGIIMDMEAWEWRTIHQSVEDAYANGTEGTCAWGDRLFNFIQDGTLYRQDFVLPDITEDGRIYFAQPMDISGGNDGHAPVTQLGVVDGQDYNVWRGAFFRPGEMNCLIHPFTLHMPNELLPDLNSAPLLELPGGSANGIIAILIGQFGVPVPFADVQFVGDNGTLNLKTNIYGQMEIPVNAGGEYSLQTSWTQLNGTERSMDYAINVDMEKSLYSFR
ncbi:MAG: hypothetical protein R3F46_06690 [bacterium]